MKNNYTIREWLGFNYEEYLDDIKEAITKDQFALLKADSKLDLELGKLSEKQLIKFKDVLIKNFEQGNSIRDISRDLLNEVKISDRKQLKGEEMVTVLPKEPRSVIIARTETTRMANEGSVLRYEKAGVEKYRWVSTLDGRTSAICTELNGQLFSINSGIKPPAHVGCRSTIVPEVELK